MSPFQILQAIDDVGSGNRFLTPFSPASSHFCRLTIPVHKFIATTVLKSLLGDWR
ncbi:MAG: hypothetical protein ACREJN_19630 [Nitrospiraceae bacterium]